MRHVFTVCCSHAAIDIATNNVSLFNILEQVRIDIQGTHAFPIALPFEATLLTLWMREDVDMPTRGFARTRFLAPDGDVLGTWNTTIDLTQFVRLRSRSVFNTIRIGGPGLHEWVIDRAPADAPDNWTEVARVPLQVLLAENIEADADGVDA